MVDVEVAALDGVQDRALLVRRFDRLPSGAKIHFEEFNQLLARRSGDDKYEASYEDMAKFILTSPACAPVDAWRLYRRVLVCFITANTDAHLKNFAMFHTNDGLRLTPAYDLVAAALYPEYSQLALAIGNAANMPLGDVKPKHVIKLGEGYKLSAEVIADVVNTLDLKRKAADAAVRKGAAKIGAEQLGDNLIDYMERRWNGTFASIGKLLSKKRSDDGDR